MACIERIVGGTAAFLIAAGTLASQQSETKIPANDLVREVVAQEVAAANQPSSRHMFCSHKQTSKGSQTRLYVETKDAMAGMLVAVNDQPLSAQQKQAETDRLYWLSGNPEQLRKKRAREKEDADRTLRIVKALPDAFRYQYAGTEAGSTEIGKAGDELLKVTFSPNPDYSPPSKVEQVLDGMEGYLLIDPTARRIAKIDGALFREVSFGWGLIGHLDKGGHFVVQQADVGDGTWDITLMSLKITGKILLLKGISMISDEKFSDFQAVAQDLSFAQGVDLLKNEQEKLAHYHETEAAAEKKEQR